MTELIDVSQLLSSANAVLVSLHQRKISTYVGPGLRPTHIYTRQLVPDINVATTLWLPMKVVSILNLVDLNILASTAFNDFKEKYGFSLTKVKTLWLALKKNQKQYGLGYHSGE